jgi:nucleotide-binding universal stress UspA family protein
MNKEADGVYDIKPLDLETPSNEMLTSFEEKLKSEGINAVVTITKAGDPSEVIVEIAESGDFHLILMCTHGMGAAKRLLIGSVTNKVVHHSSVPVIVIRE